MPKAVFSASSVHKKKKNKSLVSKLMELSSALSCDYLRGFLNSNIFKYCCDDVMEYFRTDVGFDYASDKCVNLCISIFISYTLHNIVARVIQFIVNY